MCVCVCIYIYIYIYIICIHKQSTSALHLGASQPAAQMQKKETYPQTQNKYGGMRVPELKKALEGRGLRKSGNKPELIQVYVCIHIPSSFRNATPLMPI